MPTTHTVRAVAAAARRATSATRSAAALGGRVRHHGLSSSSSPVLWSLTLSSPALSSVGNQPRRAGTNSAAGANAACAVPRSVPAALRDAAVERAANAFGPVRVDAFQSSGFTVNGAVTENTALLLLPNFYVALPHVHSLAALTPEALALLEMLDPAPRILLFGAGERAPTASGAHSAVPEAVRAYMRDTLRIGFEVSGAPDACATFNFLNGEWRRPAAVLLPTRIVDTRAARAEAPTAASMSATTS